MSNITTGLNTQAKVVITSGTPDLVLVGAEQSVTFQLTATIKDVNGNSQSGDLYYVSRDPSIVTVSDSGLLTAVSEGGAIVEVSTPAFGNTILTFNRDGSPLNKVYAEQVVTVLPGVPLEPDFNFSLDSDSYTVSPNGTFSVTITQTVENGFGDGTVGYQLTTNYPIYPPSQPPSQPLPTLGYHFYTPSGGIPVTIAGNLGGTVSGSGTLTLNFQAQDAPAGTVPLIVYGFSPVFYNVPGANLNVPVRMHVATATLTVT